MKGDELQLSFSNKRAISKKTDEELRVDFLKEITDESFDKTLEEIRTLKIGLRQVEDLWGTPETQIAWRELVKQDSYDVIKKAKSLILEIELFINYVEFASKSYVLGKEKRYEFD